MDQTHHWFAGLQLNRCSDEREDAAWLNAQLGHIGARFVPVLRTHNLISSGELIVLDTKDRAQVEAERDPIFLGVDESGPWFALPVTERAADTLSQKHDGTFGDLRFAASQLAPDSAALGAYARALTYWQHRHRYCGVCGSETTPQAGGARLKCEQCNRPIFPRVDPAIIVLVHDGDQRCLLGRQANWPKGLYSTLAGFVEPGETLEEAVGREVAEESGVIVEPSTIDYHSSQPWPFPSSLMLGFYAEARNTTIQCGVELEDAAWFTREQILEQVQTQDMKLPRNVSISRVLLDGWVSRRQCRVP